jgi:hypothetical protein
MANKFKHGDVFSFRLPNEKFIFGRILLDVNKQCIKPKLLKQDSPLGFFKDCILIEIYKELSTHNDFAPSEVLINGIFVDLYLLKKGLWEIIDCQEVDPTKVEFPEAMNAFEEHALFRKGEIVLPLSLNEDNLRIINVYPTIVPSAVLSDICLYYLDFKHLIDPDYLVTSNLRNSDLRFSEHRREIYQMLGKDENQSYYDMSTQLGYNITRFYK